MAVVNGVAKTVVGLVLVVIVLVGRERISQWTAPFRRLAAHLNWRALRRRLAMSPGEGR